jgi:uncharacterized membrane protein
MAFCAKCGAQVNQGTAFCPACGNAVATTAGGAAVAPAPAANSGAASTGMSNNVAGCLAYLLGWITGLIFLLIEPYKNDRNVKFHAFQSIFLDVGFIAACIALSILGFILAVISRGFAGLIMLPLWPILWIGFFATRIFLMIKAYNNQQFKLPFIGDLAAKQAGL